MTPWILTCVIGRVELLFAELGKTAGRTSLGNYQKFIFEQVRFEMHIRHASVDNGFHQATLARRLDWWE